jgi:hypothetical protein
MCECSPVFVADEKLKKMLTIVLIILVLNGIIGILTGIFINWSMAFQILINVLILFCAYNSLRYTYVSIYIFFTMLNAFTVFIFVGIQIQQILLVGQSGIKKTADYVAFSLLLFTLVFDVFSIIFVFPAYREMKAQFYEHSTGQRVDPEEGENRNTNSAYNPPGVVSNNQTNNNTNTNTNDNNNNNSSSNNTGFRAFQGRGTAVGGN